LLGALLSKTVTASLPAALLIIVWWRDGTINKRAIMGALPWFVIGALLGWITVHLEATHVGAANAPWQLVGSQRLVVAGSACWFYFGSLLWPFDTCFNYPRWDVNPPSMLLWAAPIGALVAVATTWLLRARIGRGPAAMLLLFGGTLVPAIGFFDVYPFRYSFVADHFQYHASIGVIVAVSAVATRLLMARVAENIAIAVAGAWLVLMAITTSTLLPQYDSFERIWLSSLEKNPRSALSLLNLGGLATDARDLTKARDYLTRCLAIDDTSDEANANLGIVEHLSGNPAEAKKFYLRALELAPGEVNTRNNLAVLSLEQGDKQEAVRLAKEAVTMDPGYSTAHATLAWALTESRKWQQAIVELQWVLARSPHVLESRRRMATCLLALNDPGNAASHALFAVKGHPKDQDSRRLLAKAMAQVLRAEPPQSVRQKAVAAIQAGGVDALAILPMIALELRALGATAQADAVAGS
jgi:tetratricopeptide (TPR) repeat protein